MTPVQVDWLSVVLGPVVVITLGLALYARWRKRSAQGPEAARQLPPWARTLQVVGTVCALFLGFVQIVWGN